MTKYIQKLVGKMQVLKFHTACENVSNAINGFEMDVLSISKSGMVYEFEIKISRSDFLRDRFKTNGGGISKMESYKAAFKAPNYFSYVCPDGMIKESDIGSGIGLYYFFDKIGIIEIRAPKKLHNFLHDQNKLLAKICRINSERNFLGSSRLTYENNLKVGDKVL